MYKRISETKKKSMKVQSVKCVFHISFYEKAFIKSDFFERYANKFRCFIKHAQLCEFMCKYRTFVCMCLNVSDYMYLSCTSVQTSLIIHVKTISRN